MIRYTLTCSNAHSFESWFKSADGFETLQQAGQIICPECGDVHVSKSLMAPRVTTARSKAAPPPAPQETAGTPAPLEAEAPAPTAAEGADPGPVPATPSSPEQREQLIAEMRKEVEANSEYVGMEFTAKARAMHAGEAEAKPIYGEAKPEEAKALLEEGVPVLPLPFTPKRKMN